MNKLNKRILIVAKELQEALGKPQTVAVDCRFDLADPSAGRRSYAQGHVPGAVFLDLDEDLAGSVTETTGRHPLPDPEADPPMREPVDYQTSVRDDLVLTTDELPRTEEVIAALNLLDARDGARFRGEHEPIDPVAGHIPGTRNLPFGEFVHDDGTWRPLEERAALLSRALDGRQADAWSVMCGSGVTACHLAISGLEAGFREPRLYAGSWSEWIRDLRRPVAMDEA